MFFAAFELIKLKYLMREVSKNYSKKTLQKKIALDDHQNKWLLHIQTDYIFFSEFSEDKMNIHAPHKSYKNL